MLFAVSISPMIRFFRDVCSLTWTLNSTGTAAPTLSSSQSTVPVSPRTTTTVTALVRFSRLPFGHTVLTLKGQTLIHTNTAAYSPNTLHDSAPRQANQEEGRGFFTAPKRQFSSKLMRQQSTTFADVWSQPRLFYNSLPAIEQQFLVDALKFETSQLTNDVVKQNVITQLNRISHEIATEVASALNMEVPEPDSTYYHDNVTVGMSVFEEPLQKLDGMRVAVLTSGDSSTDYEAIKSGFAESGVDIITVGETLASGIDQTYSTADATQYDGVIIDTASVDMFRPITRSPHYPSGRPLNIFLDAYRWGKAVGITKADDNVSNTILGYADIQPDAPGLFLGDLDGDYVSTFEGGLKMNRYLSRFVIEQ